VQSTQQSTQPALPDVKTTKEGPELKMCISPDAAEDGSFGTMKLKMRPSQVEVEDVHIAR
jgi:hypothetical protein